MQPRTRASLVVNLFLLAAMIGLQALFFSGSSAEEIAYSDFLQRVDAGRVESVAIGDEHLYGYMKAAEGADDGKTTAPPAPPAKHTPWHVDVGRWLEGMEHGFEEARARAAAEAARHFTVLPVQDPGLVGRLERHGVAFRAKVESHWLGNLVSNWVVPFGVMILLSVFVMRRMAASGGSPLQVGKSQAKVYEVDPENLVRFADVAGVDEAVEEVQEVVAFLKEPERFTRLGAKLPKGVLLVGPPGTGKTLLAKAVAGESGVPFYSLSGSDFVEMFVGVGASRVRDLFESAKQKAPCIVFIDELDAIGKSRGQRPGMAGGFDESENTLNQLLVELDGFDASGKPGEGGGSVVIIGATNRPEVLDPALLRPGRFDRQVLVDRPHHAGRRAIFEVHARNLVLAPDVDLDGMASQTAGMVGADIGNLCNEAALLASRRDHAQVENGDFQDAFERVVGGIERKGSVMSEKDRRTVAYHESGHALVGHFTPGADPVKKISIVPRGHGALGYTLQSPDEEHLLMSRSELLGRIRTLLGGRAAEEIVFGEVSTGAADDLVKANQLARDMVTVYGMSPAHPNLSLAQSAAPDFLGGRPPEVPHSEELDRAIDAERQEVVDRAYAEARELIADRRAELESLAQRLLEHEKVDAGDLEGILGPPTH